MNFIARQALATTIGSVVLLSPLAGAAQDSLQVDVIVRSVTGSGLAVSYGRAGAEVSVGEATCTTDAEGRCRLSGFAAGTQTVTVRSAGLQTEEAELDLSSGNPARIALVAQGACPEGLACLVSADAVAELALATNEEPPTGFADLSRQARLVGQDGSFGPVTEIELRGLPHEFELSFGEEQFSLQLTSEEGFVGYMWMGRLLQSDGTQVASGAVYGLNDGVMPGCMVLAVEGSATVAALELARAGVGDPLGYCGQ